MLDAPVVKETLKLANSKIYQEPIERPETDQRKVQDRTERYQSHNDED